MIKEFKRLRELAKRLPNGLGSDWDGTNHYELTTPAGREYFWLMVGDGINGLENPCETEQGKRLGLIMDIAEEVCRLNENGVL